MSKKESNKSWENRVLCSDESCIGVIGPDGRCKECGLPFEGELPLEIYGDSSSIETDVASGGAGADDSESAVDSGSVERQASEASSSDDEWANRKLCSDESCIGVIGADGQCKECGRPYTGNA